MNAGNRFARLRPVRDEILRGVATSLHEALPQSPAQRAAVVRSLEKTMHACGGVGLAAPQIGAPFRVAVMEDPSELTTLVFVDPTFSYIGKDRDLVEGEEGCLSLPGRRFVVKRYPAIKVNSHIDPRYPITYILRGFAARVAQHELDHLDGRLIDVTGVEVALEQKEAS